MWQTVGRNQDAESCTPRQHYEVILITQQDVKVRIRTKLADAVDEDVSILSFV